MHVHRHNVISGAACAALILCTACDSQERTGAQVRPAACKLVAAESLHWSRAQACAHLADQHLGLSAAVRLVRLAGVSALCVPPDLTDRQVRLLRLVRLDNDHWALGIAKGPEDNRLWAPLTISSVGAVTRLADGVDEELAVLCVSRNPDTFPHLVILPQRVSLLADELIPAIVLEPGQSVRFALREQQGFGYVALLAAAASGEQEVARYLWDPYEEVFTGPARDRLPDPQGGSFQVDRQLSQRLEPVGGGVPPPQDNKPGPDQAPEEPPSPEELLAA